MPSVAMGVQRIAREKYLEEGRSLHAYNDEGGGDLSLPLRALP